MASFVDFITNPAWWGVILSAISTIAVILIAVVQIRMQHQQTQLQELQTKQQDYEPNKKLLIIIKGIDIQIEYLLYTLLYMLIGDVKSSIISRLSEKKTELDALDKQLINHTIDFELRFPTEKTLISDYRIINYNMYHIYSLFQKHIENGDINLEDEFDIEEAAEIISSNNDEKYKEGILFYIKDKNVQNQIITSLDKFIKQKNAIQDKKYADKMQNAARLIRL